MKKWIFNDLFGQSNDLLHFLLHRHVANIRVYDCVRSSTIEYDRAVARMMMMAQSTLTAHGQADQSYTLAEIIIIIP